MSIVWAGCVILAAILGRLLSKLVVQILVERRQAKESLQQAHQDKLPDHVKTCEECQGDIRQQIKAGRGEAYKECKRCRDVRRSDLTWTASFYHAQTRICLNHDCELNELLYEYLEKL